MITIHGIFGSPFVRSLRIALAEKNLPYAWADVGFGNTKAEPHISRHPFGRIPAIDDDGFDLYETQAVLRYLERIAPLPALIPDDARQEARMNQLMGISDCYFFPQVTATISFNRLMAPRLGLPVNEAVVAEGVPKAKTCLTAITSLMVDAPYLTGDKLSLADVMLFPNIQPLGVTPEGLGLMPEFPALAAWVARMEALPSVQHANAPPR